MSLEASRKRSAGARSAAAWHDVLASYFDALPLFEGGADGWGLDDAPVARKVEELPYHLTLAGRFDDAARVLCDLWFVEAKVRAGEVAALEKDYERVLDAMGENDERRYWAELAQYEGALAAGEQPEPPALRSEVEIRAEDERTATCSTKVDRLRVFRNFVRAEADRLEQHGAQAGFTVQTAYNGADRGPVGEQAAALAARAPRDLLLHPSAARREHTAFPALLRTFREDQLGLDSLLPAGAVLSSAENRVVVWDLASGDQVHVLAHEGMKGCAACVDHQRALSWSSRGARLWDLSSGTCVAAIEAPEDDLDSIHFFDSRRRAVIARKGALQAIDLSAGAALDTFSFEPGSVRVAGLLRDERRILAVDSSSRLHLLDFQTGARVDFEKTASWEATLFDDDRKVVSLCRDQRESPFRDERDSSLRVWEVSTGACVLECAGAPEGRVRPFDGGKGAIAWRMGRPELLVWDLTNGNVRLLPDTHGRVYWVSVLRDGRRALSVGYEGTIALWDLPSGTRLQTMSVGTGENSFQTMSNDERLLTWGADGKVRLWNLPQGRLLRVFEGQHGRLVASFKRLLLADGKRLCTWEGEARISVWDLKSGACVHTFEHRSNVRNAFALPDGRRLLSNARDGFHYLWDLNAKPSTVTQDSAIGGVHLLDERRVLACHEDGTIAVWNLSSRTLERRLSGHASCADAFRLLDEGRRLLSWRRFALRDGDRDYSLRMWDLDSGRCLATSSGDTRGACDVHVFRDERRALTSASDKVLRLWDLEMGTCLRTFKGGSVALLQVSEDEHGVLGWSGGELTYWGLDSGERLREMRLRERDGSVAADASILADGKRVLSRTHLGLQIWDLERQAPPTMLNHPRAEGHLALGEQRVLSWGRDRTLRLWDLGTASLISSLTGHTGPINRVAPLSDGRRVLSWSHCWEVAPPHERTKDFTLRLWDLRDLRSQVFDGHTRPVRDVLFLDDERRLLSCSADGTLRLWDVSDGSCVATLRGHEGPVRGMLACANRIVSWGEDKTLRLWDGSNGDRIATWQIEAVNGEVWPLGDGRHVVAGLRTFGPRMVWLLDVVAGRCVGKLDGATCMQLLPGGIAAVTERSDPGKLMLIDLVAAHRSVAWHPSRMLCAALSPRKVDLYEYHVASGYTELVRSVVLERVAEPGRGIVWDRVGTHLRYWGPDERPHVAAVFDGSDVERAWLPLAEVSHDGRFRAERSGDALIVRGVQT